jgi:hypothetical protein
MQKPQIIIKDQSCKKELLWEVRDREEVICVLDKAVEFLIQGLSYSEALEYCADPELTKVLENIAGNLSYNAIA